VATLLATLPGLPMIGHGQIEGFGEKYGMEFRRARLDEQPNEELIARFEREIVPLLHERARYAGAADFHLYDVTGDDGAIVDDVFAYSNGRGSDRSLVVYHNRFGTAAGWIRVSVPFARKAGDGSKALATATLAGAFEIPSDPDVFVAYREARSGLEYLRPAREVVERGLFVELDAYRCLVFGSFRELRHAPDERWAELAARLAGTGVPSLDDALADVRLAPVHGAVTALLAPDLEPAEVARRRAVLMERAGLPAVAAATAVRRGAAPTPAPSDLDPAARAAALLRPIDRAQFDELRLGKALRAIGFDAWAIARIRIALGLARPSQVRDPARLAAAWLDDHEIRAFLGVNTWEGVEWFSKESFETLLALVAALERADGVSRTSAAIGKLRRAAEEAGYRVDQFRAALQAPAKPARPAKKAPRPRSS
jgi:hypothetical protein